MSTKTYGRALADLRDKTMDMILDLTPAERVLLDKRMGTKIEDFGFCSKCGHTQSYCSAFRAEDEPCNAGR